MTRGTLVLTPFPFTDLTGTKVRPAVVISATNRPGVDVILAFISSVVPPSLPPTDLAILPSHVDFKPSGLKGPSVARCDKLATVDSRIVLGQLGTLSPALLQELDQRLRIALAL